jgi:hypothetical protein
MMQSEVANERAMALASQADERRLFKDAMAAI